jgi:hypothetical protein
LFELLPPPAKYFPFESGVYDVRPGLRAMGYDFGNRAADGRLFQVDAEFSAYRSAKLEARREELGRHVLVDGDSDTMGAVTRWMVERLVAEHPLLFSLSGEATIQRLHCQLTGEVLCFDEAWRLLNDGVRSDVQPMYVSAWDALACQVQEDFAITTMSGPANRIAALHVCLPSHWRPEEKLGLDFAAVHAPVPGMEVFSREQEKFVRKMVGATGGLVRFVWGLQWTDQLNRHPARCSPEERFDPDRPRAFVRVERQTIWGLPESNASLFAIRPYLMDAREIQCDRTRAIALAAAIRSMSEESLRYKGMLQDRERFVEWLVGG